MQNQDNESLILINTFLTEADSFLEEMEIGLLSLEERQDDVNLLNQVFRSAHSLKGSSMAVGLTQISSFTHELEALLLEIKENRIKASSDIIGVLLKSNDHIKFMILNLKKDLTMSFDSEPILNEIRKFHQVKKVITNQAFGFFDDEPVVAKSMIKENKNINTVVSKEIEQIKVSQEKIDKLINNIGEMSILLSVLQEQLNQIAGTKGQGTVKQLYKVSKDIQDMSIGLRMLPVKPVFQKLKRIVRDVSAKLNKKIELEFKGEDLEVDKTVLDLIADPLVHIIRNAVDHGIESEEERLVANKNGTGKISLDACLENGKLVFYIQDDGKGIDADKVKVKALKLGLVKETDILSSEDLVNLIFHAGFSTKEQVTDVSGRGVGMDVVKNNIDKMSGEINVQTEKGKGTLFKITLPQTFSIIDGTVVEANHQKFVIPLNDVIESVRVTNDIYSMSSTLGPVLDLRGKTILAFRLDDLCSNKRNMIPSEQIALITKSGDEIFAVIVDEIVNHQPVVVKKLGIEMQEFKEFVGSTILGDGKPSLIVDLGTLIRSSKENKKKLNLTKKEDIYEH